jgi:Na+-translocating ferredoxin:NAD+ oxidoreductase RnfE subunit
MIEFLIYVIGVAFISWYTPTLRSSLGTFVYLVILICYLLGVAKAAELIGAWLRKKPWGA